MSILKLGINRTPSRLGLLGGTRGVRALLGPGVAVDPYDLVESDNWSGAYGDGDPRTMGVADGDRMLTIGRIANSRPTHRTTHRVSSSVSAHHGFGDEAPERQSSVEDAEISGYGYRKQLPVPVRPRISVAPGTYGRDRYGRMASFDFEGWDDDGWTTDDWGAYPDGNPTIGYIRDEWSEGDWAADGEEGAFRDGPEPVSGALRFSGGAAQEKIASGARKLADTVRTRAKAGYDKASPWNTEELAPGVRVQVAKGNKATVTNIGTADRPSWKIDPALGALGLYGVGALGVAALLKGGAAAARLKGSAVGQKVAEKVRPIGRKVFKERTAMLDERRGSPFASRIEPGGMITIGTLGGVGDGDFAPQDSDLVIDTDGMTFRIR